MKRRLFQRMRVHLPGHLLDDPGADFGVCPKTRSVDVEGEQSGCGVGWEGGREGKGSQRGEPAL